MKYIPYDHRLEVNPRKLIDMGCPNFEEAAASRKRVEAGYASEYWEWLDLAVRATALGSPFPEGVPIGSLPQASGKGQSNFGEE